VGIDAAIKHFFNGDGGLTVAAVPMPEGYNLVMAPFLQGYKNTIAEECGDGRRVIHLYCTMSTCKRHTIPTVKFLVPECGRAVIISP